MPRQLVAADRCLSTEERIAVIGAGYIGLPTAAGFASLGFQVVCADSNSDKIHELHLGNVQLHEENLESLVRSGIASGNLTFTTSTHEASIGATVVFVCVPTPQSDDGSADVSAVLSVASELSKSLVEDSILVLRSTVPIGTADLVMQVLQRSDVCVASNPEFLREGSAVRDFFQPDRILLGVSSHVVGDRLKHIYESLEAPMIVTDVRTAELTKYASNAFLATRLSFVNSMSRLCDAAGADVYSMMNVLGMDPRIGPRFLSPGPGWGGSCLPKDTRALLQIAREFGEPLKQLESTIDDNQDHIEYIVDRLELLVGAGLADKSIAVWGLSFKAGTNDLRESPSVEVVRRLLSRGARVTVFDPVVGSGSVANLEVRYATSAEDACSDADALVVLTEWPEFGSISPVELAMRMVSPKALDTRRVLNSKSWRASGFNLEVLGEGLPSLMKSSPTVSAA